MVGNKELLTVAQRAVREVGDTLTNTKLRPSPHKKKDASPDTMFDQWAGAWLRERLSQQTGFPAYSESHHEPTERTRYRSFWWIDPIDGTRSFTMGEEFYSVSLALVQDQRPVLGVVYQPRKKTLFWAITDERAYIKIQGKQTRRLSVSKRKSDSSAIAVLGTTDSPQTIDIYHSLSAQTTSPVGSFTYKLGMILQKKADLYIKPNQRCHEWDSAAMEVILHEAGGKLTDLYSNPLEYNKENPRHMKGIVASNGHIHDQVIEFLQKEYISTGKIQL